MLQSYDYVTMLVYLAFLLGVGWAFGRMSKTTSDFVRGGGKGTWWLVGSSSLLAGISAFTFSGNAAGAYDAGPTLLIIYLANTLAFLVHAAFLASRFRQTRAFTAADVVRERFGPAVEQFSAYYSVVIGALTGAVPLWALASFCSGVFAIPQDTLIVVLGTVVTLYAIKGGKWAVMGNDFVQSLIIYPITILLAILALREVGGVSALIENFSRPDLAADFSFVKEPGQFPGDNFTWTWIIAAFITQFLAYVNLGSASRYLAARDGREATRSALLAAAGMGFGALVWFIPPWVTRMLWSADVEAMAALGEPANSAYAIAALKLLPAGLVGVMVVAMFAATLSTMDVGLNGNAGTLIRNVIPPLRRVLGLSALGDKQLMLAGKIGTLVMGALTIALALYFSKLKGFRLFDAFLQINSLIGMPLIMPMIAGLVVRRLPRWSFFWILGMSAVPAVLSLFAATPWTYSERSLWVFAAGVAATLTAIPFYAREPADYRERVDGFFTKMNTPLNDEERGKSSDAMQASILGKASLAMAGALLFLLFIPNPAWGRYCILAISGSVALVGGLLLLGARAERRRLGANPEPTNAN